MDANQIADQLEALGATVDRSTFAQKMQDTNYAKSVQEILTAHGGQANDGMPAGWVQTAPNAWHNTNGGPVDNPVPVEGSTTVVRPTNPPTSPLQQAAQTIFQGGRDALAVPLSAAEATVRKSFGAEDANGNPASWNDLYQNAYNQRNQGFRSVGDNPLLYASLLTPEMEVPALGVGLLARMAPKIAAGAMQGLATAGAEQYSDPYATANPAEALGAGLISGGLGGAASGAAQDVGQKLQTAATPLLVKAVKPLTKNQEDFTQATPIMLKRGVVGPTFGSTLDRIAAENQKVSGPGGMYEQAIAQYPDATVNLSDAALNAYGDLENAAAAGKVMPSTMSSPVNALLEQADYGRAGDAASVGKALASRKTARNWSGAYEPGDITAKQLLGEAYGNQINSQLDQVAPNVRAVDQYVAPLRAFQGSIPQMEARMRQHDFGLMDATRAGMSGALASKFGPLGWPIGFGVGAASSMAERSPMAAYLSYGLGAKMPVVGTALYRGATALPAVAQPGASVP